ncbi:Opioid-binding protein/cell adhesion molecule [Stylophora pistillata]|uniref:Opioid-binding protein/cell adhesion molecule n=1 Tax=Stylophora pistillata TaxID=50429 RepID=A0A2B4R8Z4_STYPI|nr:Opioid-binding protein/cell adhesion molecule [Stylophora pistillata]
MEFKPIYAFVCKSLLPPKITSYTHNITADEGSKLDLFCNTTGKPAPSITWTTVLKDGTNSNLKVLYVGNPWNISNIRRNYSGTYHCIADNGIGSPINRAISVNVLYKPLANSLKRRTVSEGEHVKISCLEDSGNPSAVITWYKGNDTSGNKMIKSSTLEFQNASSSDEGWYSCFATKGIENVSATFFLSVVQKTSPAPTTEPSTASILCSEAPSANKFRGSATVEADCKNRSQVAAKLVHQFVELLKNEDSELGKSCGTSSSNHSTLSDGVPCDYGKSGQQPLKDHRVEQQQGAVGSEAISTHAVVDKSGKKVKKKTNKAVEQKPVADQYAKPKPGEILYGDLGEFHQMKKMPEVSTSTETLPPIKRPEAYAKTQYAEITQYLKGNPEDLGAELLKDSITPAVTNTATGSKVESSAGNTGDGAEATIETGV